MIRYKEAIVEWAPFYNKEMPFTVKVHAREDNTNFYKGLIEEAETVLSQVSAGKGTRRAGLEKAIAFYKSEIQIRQAIIDEGKPK